MSESYLTVSEIAERLRVSRATAYKICRQIGFLRLGSGPRASIRVLLKDYEEWSSENWQEPLRETSE